MIQSCTMPSILRPTEDTPNQMWYPLPCILRHLSNSRYLNLCLRLCKAKSLWGQKIGNVNSLLLKGYFQIVSWNDLAKQNWAARIKISLKDSLRQGYCCTYLAIGGSISPGPLSPLCRVRPDPQNLFSWCGMGYGFGQNNAILQETE